MNKTILIIIVLAIAFIAWRYLAKQGAAGTTADAGGDNASGPGGPVGPDGQVDPTIPIKWTSVAPPVGSTDTSGAPKEPLSVMTPHRGTVTYNAGGGITGPIDTSGSWHPLSNGYGNGSPPITTPLSKFGGATSFRGGNLSTPPVNPAVGSFGSMRGSASAPAPRPADLPPTTITRSGRTGVLRH